MTDLDAAIAAAKARLDALRPLQSAALEALRNYYDIELTYTSNAIEGNTLTASETAELIEHGITVVGKPLRDHLEVLDHHAALGWMRELAATDSVLGERVVTELQRRIMLRSNPEIAGFYSLHLRRIVGSAVVFPNPAKVPTLMASFGGWLADTPASMETAFDAHYRLVSIHPFTDGNGRTARLLMNLLLIRGGYPPVAVRPEDRRGYIDALETAQVSEDRAPYDRLLRERLLATLEDYVAAIQPD